jgi:hypothetical protein
MSGSATTHREYHHDCSLRTELFTYRNDLVAPGYVAHDAAADPASLLDTTVAVDSGGVIREIAVTWGTWTYTVTYSGLGSTAAPTAPENATPLRELRHVAPRP